jgi:ribosome biogenesis protein YTM1
MFRSHKGWISDVTWSPIEPHMFATTSHDGYVKMWDIRSTIPLHSVRAHRKGEKGLCVALGKKVMFSGGTDCTVKKFDW